ncbi:MAG: endonuclease III [Planctomycetes bacterium]|jgi:endonuclease-3|nr:endonuclease III [Planctomycetota bacterium]
MRSPADVRKVLRRLAKMFPEATCALHHSNALELLVATILSAQCTDERVNMVTPALFARYPAAKDYAESDAAELEALIRSTGFFRNKAKSIRGMARMLVDRFGGEVPDRMEELVTLPGVARKTASVVLGTWFGRAEGIVVDTHVARIAKRLGLTAKDDPGKIEADLMARIPKKEWIDFSHRVIWHGRGLCKARKPDCAPCALRDICPSARAAE